MECVYTKPGRGSKSVIACEAAACGGLWLGGREVNRGREETRGERGD